MKRHVITSIACVAAAVSGYLLAHPWQPDSSPAKEDPSSSGAPSSLIQDRDTPDAPEHKRRNSAELGTLKDSLLARLGKSPDAWHDWPLRRQISAALSGLSARELQELAMSLHDPGTKFKSIPVHQDHRSTLLREILLQWSLLDPAAAIACQEHHSLTSGYPIFNTWRNRSPEEAQAWLFSADHPEELRKTVANLRFLELSSLGSTDFNAALSQWDLVNPSQQRQLLASWGKLLLEDPAKRDQILAKIAALPDRNAAFSYYENLIRGIADKDPSQTARLVGQLDVDETQRAKLSDALIAGWMKKEPAAALDHWISLGDDKLTREMAFGFSEWLNVGKTMKPAAEWFAKVPPGPARTALEKEAVSSYIHYDYHASAAKVALDMADPDLRAEQLNIVHREWMEARPDSAKKWVESLPESDRALLVK
jgi:hypothetical protein